MQDEGKKSNLEKTREYAKNEWLKYHPEDKEKLENIYKPQKQQPPHKQKNGEIYFSAIAGIICSLVVAGLWIALFCGEEFFILTIPLVSTLTYIFSGIYIKECKDTDGVCFYFIIFYVANLITSIVAFCIDASTNIGFTAFLNFMLPAFLLGRNSK